MSLTEIINTSEFAVLFPVLIPIVVSVLAYLFLEPLLERWGWRNKLAGKIVKLVIDENNIREPNVITLTFNIVNDAKKRLLIKIAHLYINGSWYQKLEDRERLFTGSDILSIEEDYSYVKRFDEGWVNKLKGNNDEGWYPEKIKEIDFVVTLLGDKELKKKLPEEYVCRINDIFQKYKQ